MKIKLMVVACCFMGIAFCASALAYNANPGELAGPYSGAMGEPNSPVAVDVGIPGFVGPEGDGVAPKSQFYSSKNYVNPIFKGWATGYRDYLPAAQNIQTQWTDPTKALGAVTGSNFDIVSLGDMNQTQIDAWKADPVNAPGPGEITFTFDSAIVNGNGADFTTFENGFISAGGAGHAGEIFAELCFVEVSTDGINFARFASDSLTEDLVGPYGTVDPSNVYNLAGKHVNAYGSSWGTPFDLETLLENPLVLGGLVDLNDINFVKIIDIPGSGDFVDADGDPIYDAWVTWGSGGMDFEALGVINQSPVPVPGAIWLLGSGLIGLIGLGKKKRVR